MRLHVAKQSHVDQQRVWAIGDSKDLAGSQPAAEASPLGGRQTKGPGVFRYRLTIVSAL